MLSHWWHFYTSAARDASDKSHKDDEDDGDELNFVWAKRLSHILKAFQQSG